MIEKDKKLSFESNAFGEKLTHKLIIGENYDALKNLLAVYENKIDFIYIDPPYNTESTRTDGNSLTDIEGQNTGKFIYRDKFSRTGWLNMMNERLQLARKLLSDKGVIFISIDDNEQAYLKVLCDDVFGEENFVACFKWKKTNKPSGNTSVDKFFIDKQFEYILLYCKNMNRLTSFNLNLNTEEQLKEKGYILKDEYFEERGYYCLTPLWHSNSGSSFGYVESLDYEIEAPDGTKFKIYQNENKDKNNKMCYTWSKDTFNVGKKLGFIEIKKDKSGNWCAYRKMYEKVKFDPKSRRIVAQASGNPYTDSIIGHTTDESARLLKDLGVYFSFSKPVALIKHLLKIASQKDSIILDFFAGSGTTGQAVMELNEEDGGKRQFILCTNNENGIAENITYERLYRVINGEGTKGEQFKWQYSKDKKSLVNNNLDVFKIGYHQLGIEDYDKGNELVKQAKEVFKQLDNNFELKSEFDIYNKLASLKPFNECGLALAFYPKQQSEENEEEHD